MKKSIISITLVIALVFTALMYPLEVHAEDEEYKEFLQGDPRWADYVYGSSETIGSAGCAITSFAILMAYADPSLRDVSKFNPQVCASDYLDFEGDAVYWNPVAGPLTLREDLSFVATSEEDAIEGIKDALDGGYYVIMWGTPVYSGGYGSSTHYSPVVGWDDATGKPILWDVATGGNTWEAFADGGITSNAIHIYESSVLPSDEALSGASSVSSSDLTDEQKAIANNTITQWELNGMPEKSKIADQSLELEFYGSSDLTLAERINLGDIQEGMQSRIKTISQVLSIVVTILGLLLLVYTMVLLVGCFFDRTNSFLNVSIVSVMTLGKLKVIELDDELTPEQKKDGYISSNSLYVRCAVMFIIGGLLVSGVIPELVMKIVYSII